MFTCLVEYIYMESIFDYLECILLAVRKKGIITVSAVEENCCSENSDFRAAAAVLCRQRAAQATGKQRVQRRSDSSVGIPQCSAGVGEVRLAKLHRQPKLSSLTVCVKHNSSDSRIEWEPFVGSSRTRRSMEARARNLALSRYVTSLSEFD